MKIFLILCAIAITVATITIVSIQLNAGEPAVITHHVEPTEDKLVKIPKNDAHLSISTRGGIAHCSEGICFDMTNGRIGFDVGGIALIP